tara:strand:- start:62 stop:292 length:231 start_codon:yes stop_codon:yes gene_type:complete
MGWQNILKIKDEGRFLPKNDPRKTKRKTFGGVATGTYQSNLDKLLRRFGADKITLEEYIEEKNRLEIQFGLKEEDE